VKNLLQVKKGNIVSGDGKPVILKGINFGSWLNMEGYILGGRNISEHAFKDNFRSLNGEAALAEFTRLFRDNFIREADFKKVKNLGFNCIRLPFNFRLVKSKDIYYLEKAVKLCAKFGLYCILDMHAAPGSQNPDWHADSDGEVLIWKDKSYQREFISCWETLADKFKGEEAVAGFDILNEPVTSQSKWVLELYKKTVSAIRQIDKKHIIFLEGNPWGQNIEFFNRPWEENLVYSIHFYEPIDFTFGFMRQLKYPGRIRGKYWSKAQLRQALQKYYKIKKKWQVPIYVGEFGQNSRCPHCSREFSWLRDTLDLFRECGFHWTYWTYKAVAGPFYPDGLYQYLDNPLWLGRQRAIPGWENYYYLWKKYKKEIIVSWKTESFALNPVAAKYLAKEARINV